MPDKAKVQKIAGYILVFAALGAVMVYRKDQIKKFLGVKEKRVVSENSPEEDARYKAMSEDAAAKLKAMGIEDKMKDGKAPSLDSLMGKKPEGGVSAPSESPAAVAPTPVPVQSSISSPSGGGPAAASPGSNPVPPSDQDQGLKGMVVEVIKSTEIYMGAKVLASAPKGTRFTVLNVRDEEGKKWLQVKFKRKGEAEPIPGWIKWDDVTLATTIQEPAAPASTPIATPAGNAGA